MMEFGAGWSMRSIDIMNIELKVYIQESIYTGIHKYHFGELSELTPFSLINKLIGCNCSMLLSTMKPRQTAPKDIDLTVHQGPTAF
jgi:hypothetical protein